MPIPESDRRQLSFVRGFGYAATAFLVACFLVGVAVALFHGDVALALLFTGTTVFFVIPTYMTIVKSRFRPRVTVRAEGVEFRPDRRVDAYSAAMMVIGVGTFGAWAVLGFVGIVSFPFNTPDHYSDRWPFLIFFGGVAAFCAWYLASMLTRGGTAYLRFTAEGYASAEGFSSFRGPWSHVTDVTNRTPTYRRPGSKTDLQRPHSWCPITFTRADGTTVGIPNANLYTSDGDALREWVHFYWQHPEHRAELTDERALDRLHG